MNAFVHLFQILKTEAQEELRVALEMNLGDDAAEEAGEEGAEGKNVTEADTVPANTEQV
jgi:hypothetical protein